MKISTPPFRLTINRIMFMLLLFALYSPLIACKKLIESIEPKSFVEKYYDLSLNHQWTVDSIRYTKFDEAKKLISDEVKPVLIE